MFPHHVILQHVLGDTLELTQLAGERFVQLLSLDVLAVLGGHVFHKIEFLWCFEVARQTAKQRLIKMLFEVHVESSLRLEHLLELGTLFFGFIFGDVL